jgi:hypothetical protein
MQNLLHGKTTIVSQEVPGMVAFLCNGRIYSNDYPTTFKVGPLHTHACSIDPAVLRSTGRRLLLESSVLRPSHAI